MSFVPFVVIQIRYKQTAIELGKPSAATDVGVCGGSKKSICQTDPTGRTLGRRKNGSSNAIVAAGTVLFVDGMPVGGVRA